MKIKVITTGQEDRVNSIEKQLEKISFNFHYGESTNSCIQNIGINKKKAKHWRLKGLNKKEVSCFHSHLSLWYECSQGIEPFFIIEDNVTLLNELNIDYIESQSKYGLVSFSQRKTYDVVTAHYRKMFYTRAYLISPCKAHALYESATREAIYLPVDSFISEWIITKVRPYCAPKPLFSRQPRHVLPSLVGNDVKNKHRFKKIDIYNPFFIYIRIKRIILRLALHRHII